LRQLLRERRDAGLKFRIIRGRTEEHADPPHADGLLRERGVWPRCHRTAENCDELAPSH